MSARDPVEVVARLLVSWATPVARDKARAIVAALRAAGLLRDDAAIAAFLLDMAGAQTRGIHQDDLDHHPEKVAEARRLFALAAAVERAAKEDA